MQYTKILALATLFLSSTLAAPLDVEARACAATCGNVCYTSTAITAAQDAGYDLHSSNDDVNNYPHEYHNYEGFDFPVPGTYYEFPILSSGKVYTGNSPGADRVIFNNDNELAGLITHTGASGNNFVACT
ncbi:Guanine-specific ribonuclease N1/T1 [Penicillium cf. griseofulvum]|uniref:ribonuclease T1 n=1 Tax=Penicillium cf. griseofulvum TaxID=2972120 RepID=A0A9W9J3D8_9EURO|nr:Guanine-specific ribonuclease N1/T1 [Penicillium cf. griseofulvum]KAJ5434664.1 Guanine-specific ribonuclease N1/T1 [Penicillium cf. griseofulvum]KAJ5452493.1 Guanine-specific ribonuclease N1/T1 [Penicillium cf. griseofulvum]